MKHLKYFESNNFYYQINYDEYDDLEQEENLKFNNIEIEKINYIVKSKGGHMNTKLAIDFLNLKNILWNMNGDKDIINIYTPTDLFTLKSIISIIKITDEWFIVYNREIYRGKDDVESSNGYYTSITEKEYDGEYTGEYKYSDRFSSFTDGEVRNIKNLILTKYPDIQRKSLQRYRDRRDYGYEVGDNNISFVIHLPNEIDIYLHKLPDEWFYVSRSEGFVWSYYKCDQWDGLVKFLQDNI